MRVVGIAEQFTRTIARPRRALSSWMCVASSSLPVPVSPSSSTVESVAATCCSCSSTRRIAGALADDDPAAVRRLDFTPQVDILGLQVIAAPWAPDDVNLRRTLEIVLSARHLLAQPIEVVERPLQRSRAGLSCQSLGDHGRCEAQQIDCRRRPFVLRRREAEREDAVHFVAAR